MVCLAAFHVLLCAHISQPTSQLWGSWLIVGLLSSFHHAWPNLISLVYCKLHLITLHTIKANILIMACLIISSHWENERFTLASIMWLTNNPENKATCLVSVSKKTKKITASLTF